MIGAFKAMALRRDRPAGGGVPMKIEPEVRDKVAQLRAMNMEPEAIALALQIKLDTLKASCADELGWGAEAKKADLYLAIWQRGMDGNMAAAKLALTIAEQAKLEQLQRDADRFGRRDAEPEEKAPALGKKEQKLIDAEAVITSGEWGDRLQPTLLPGQMN